MSDLPHTWRDFRRDWPQLTLHQRFETTVAYVLTVVIAAHTPTRNPPSAPASNLPRQQVRR